MDVQVWIPQGTRNETTPHGHLDFSVRTADFSADDWGYLLNLYIYQDRMGQLLNDACIKVTLEGWKQSGRLQQAKPQYSVSDLISCIKQDETSRKLSA